MATAKKTSQKHSTKKAAPKKVANKPAKKDEHSIIDSAVSELAKQTEKLLGKSGEKMERPVLPKREKPVPTKHSTKSFDIIHQPDKATAAILKSPHPGQKLIEAHDSHKVPDVDHTPAKDKDGTYASPSIVNSHNPGTLHVASKKPAGHLKRSVAAVEDEQDNDEGSSSKEHIVPVARKQAVPKATDASSDKDVSDDSAEVLSLDSSPDNEETSLWVSGEQGMVSEVSDESAKQPVKEDTVSEASKSIQLQSDNLNEDTGGEDDKPVNILDTDEYHPTLHDWSKLSKQNHTPFYILLLLLVVLGAVLYVIYADISIPFMSL